MAWIVLGHEASKAGGAEPLKEKLTNDKLVRISPPFDDKERSDRRCGGCMYRVPLDDGGEIAECSLVKGGVQLTKGYCDWWKEGAASAQEEISKERMHYDEAGYAEQPLEIPVNCETCYYYETVDDKRGNCTLWKALVKAGQCCSKRKSDKETTPPPHIAKKPEETPAPT